MSLYAILLLGSVAVPLLLSFEKRLQFFKRWKFVLPSIFIVAAIYILFDILLSNKGVWGFNPEYISGRHMFGLPVEEVLFFFAIPYASIFLHYSFVEYFPNIKTGKKLTLFITLLLIVTSILILIFNTEKTYTTYIFAKVLIVLLLALFDKTVTTSAFYVTFLIILIPFLIVNGILTGSGINSEVVWYNNSENLGIRLFTIPVEDISYAFSMILFNLLLINKLKQTSWKNFKKKNILLLEFLRNNVGYVKIFFIYFFSVGIVGLAVPFSFPLFTKLIPFALLLSAAGLLVYHKSMGRKTILAFTLIYFIAFFVEVAGVNTGLIFGEYHYGKSLGFKIFNTPILIGLNWLILVYITESVSRKWISNRFLQVPASATLMIAYDVILEQVAPKLDMWYWADNKIPIKNYIAWFVTGLFLIVIFRIFKVKTSALLAPVLLVCHVLFFLILFMLYNL